MNEISVNIDSERVLLGAILQDGIPVLDQLRGHIAPFEFSLDSHRTIAAVMGGLAKVGAQIDVVTVMHELNRFRKLDAVGGAAYVCSLTEGLPRRPAVLEHAAIVREHFRLRELIAALDVGLNRAQEGTESALSVAGDLLGQLDRIVAPQMAAEQPEVASFIVEVMDEINREYRERVSPAVASGNAWFDQKSGGGYRLGKTTLVAARPKVGKTAWATTSVAFNCMRGVPVSIFSMEMGRGELIRNLIPYVSDVSNYVANRPFNQTAEQNRRVNEASAVIAEWPMRIYDGDIDIDQICWTIDRDADKHGVQLFVGDHLTLIGASGSDTRLKVNEISGRIRKKIKHKKAAFLMLCQLVKVAREYADKPPLPGDIKESGNPAEDAFAVLMLHRGLNKDTGKIGTDADLNLAYIRGGGGSPGTTTAHFDTKRLEFQAEAELEGLGDSYYA